MSNTISTTNKHFSVGVIIPTYQAEKHLPHCLHPLNLALKTLRTHYPLMHPCKPPLVIDSSSTDLTVHLAQQYGAEVLVIPKAEFNHGATREKARRHLNTDIVVMITQDAYVNPETLVNLITPLVESKASIAYARQCPHDGAGHHETFARDFNYPPESHIRGIDDHQHYGAYTFFCSNSCAAYLNSALDEIGGFPTVLLGEDTCAVAELLRRHHKIAYVAEATVKHSHSYTLAQEFHRNYATGVARTEYRHLLETGGRDEKRGMQYALKLFKTTLKRKPYLLPYSLLHIAAKWTGYRLGQTNALKKRRRSS